MPLFLSGDNMTSRNVTNKLTHVIAEYPKWVDGVLFKTEDEEMDAENMEERDRMVEELKEMGKPVDLRKHRGTEGFVTLKLYYEGVKSREGNDGDGDNDS
jgi:hypothetical protein